MKQKSKVRENSEYAKVLVFQRFFLLERLPLMDAHATINGIQEVSGSIPLISTKTKSHSERNGFCFILGQKGAKNAVVRRFVFLRRASAAFLRLRTENRKNTNCTEAAPQPEHPAYLHQAKDILPDVSACRKKVCRLSAFGGQIVRAAGRGLLSKNSKGVFRQPQTSFRMSFFATVPPRPTAAAAAAASRRRFSS